MKNWKTKSRKLILTSGFSWLFILEIARSQKKLKSSDSLEQYIFRIADDFFDPVLWIGGTFIAIISLMCVFDYEPILIFAMSGILTLITLVLFIFNGIKANLTISEMVKFAFIHIRKIIFIRR